MIAFHAGRYTFQEIFYPHGYIVYCSIVQFVFHRMDQDDQLHASALRELHRRGLDSTAAIFTPSPKSTPGKKRGPHTPSNDPQEPS